MKTILFTRVSTDKQDNDNQKLFLMEYAQRNNIVIDEVIETVVSSKVNRKDRKIDKVIDNLNSNDQILVYSLDRIGRSTLETLNIIEDIKNKGIILNIVKDNLLIDPTNNNPMNDLTIQILTIFSNLERTFISQRTKAALQAKKEAGVILGRRKGSQGKTQYDEYHDKIVELNNLGLSATKIINYIGIGTKASLCKYIKSRNIGIEKTTKLYIPSINKEVIT